jgi:hypothetical protein
MSHFITAFLVAALTPLLIRWLIRSTREQSAETEGSSGDFIMSPSRAYRRVAYGCGVGAVAMDAAFVYATLPYLNAAAAVEAAAGAAMAAQPAGATG